MNPTMKIFLVLLCALCLVRAQENDSARIYMQLAGTALTRAEYAQAVDLYQQVLRFRPGHPAVTYNIACAYSLLGKNKEALNWLGRAIDAGVYSFEEDSDLDNIRESGEYGKLRARADKLLKKMMGMEFDPIVSLPPGRDSAALCPLVVALHGWGSNPVDFSKALEKIPSETGYILCCPYGPEIKGKTSFGWESPESGETRVLNAMEYVSNKYNVDKKNIILLGFSQGGFYAYYIGMKNAGLFKGVISIAGSCDTTLDKYIPVARESDLKFVVMLGEDEREERLEANLELLKKFIAAGVTASFNVYAGYGHTIPGDPEFEIKRAIEWLAR